jgi:hypothetical protein
MLCCFHTLGKGTADNASKEKAIKIYKALNNPVMKAYLYFLAHILGIINSLNTEFQASALQTRQARRRQSKYTRH